MSDATISYEYAIKQKYTFISGKSYIIFVDEGNSLLWQKDASSLFNNSDNYFIIIWRERKPSHFKTGLDSMCILKTSEDGRYHWIEPQFERKENLERLGETIVCEDGNKA